MREPPSKVGSVHAAQNLSNTTVLKIGGRDSPSTHHFWSETETAAYVDWINRSLHDDTDLESILPISNEGTALFEACRDGLVLCKLVNSSVPNSIDEKALNKKPKSPIHKSENITKVLNGCRAIGIQVHNIGPEDIMKATPHLVLGLVWQIIKIGLLATINSEPLLTNGGSSVENLQEAEVTTAERRPKGPSANEKSLLSWLNKVLQQLGHEQKISNFGSDLSDSIALAKLVIYLTPEDVGPKLSIDTIQQEQDMFMRAEMVLDQANTFDCRQFATPNDIVSGSRNLNMAFVAVLYNTRARAAEAERKTRELQETLQNELVQAINRNEQQMQRSREEMEIIIQSLKQQLAQSEKGRAALEVDNETLNAQNEALNAKLLEEERRGELVASEELEALQEENTHLKSKIFSIEKESGEFRIYKINIEAKLELAATELKNYKASSDSQIAKLSDLLDAATSENFEMKGLLIEIEEDNSNVNNELSSLKAQLDVSKADLSHVKLESQQLFMKTSKSLKDSQQEISTLKQTIVRLEATNKSNVEEKQKILTKLDLVLKDLANRKDDNSAYDKKITTGFSEIASLRAQSESLQAKMLEAEIVASNLQKEKEALSAENKKIIEEAETLAAELFILKKRFSEEGNQLSTLMQHTEKELAVKIAEIATLKSQIARLEEDKARLSKQLDLAKTRLLDDCTKLHEETLELQQKLENAERRLQGAEQQVERSKSELHDNSSKIESLVSHQNDLKLENNRKEQDIIALQEQVESLLKEKLTQSEIISAREKQLLEKTKSLEEKSRESNMNLTLSRRKEMNGDGKGGSNNNRELEIVKVLLKSINAEVLDILNMEKISARNIDDNLYLSNPNLTTSANGDNTKAVIEIIIENLMKVKKQSMDRKVASEVAAEERQQKIQFREMYKNASRRLSVLEVEVDAMRTSQTIRNDAPPNLEVALDKEEIETELEAIQAIENIVSNLTNTNTMIVVESKEEMLQTLSDKVAGIKKHTVLRRNTNNTASAEHQTNVKLTRDLTEAKEEISNLQAEIIVLKTSAATSSSSGYASEPIYDYSQNIAAEEQVEKLNELEKLAQTVESESSSVENRADLLQKLQQKIGEFKQQALARATATDIAANEHQQRIKVQEQLMEAKAKISFLQSQLDSSIQAKESADQSRRTSSAEIDQVSKQELETISQMETIIHTITSTTRVESMEHILLSLKQRIEEQRAQIAARRAVLEAVADEKARNIILANQLENAKSAIGKLETDLTLLKEIVRVQSLEATEARIHAGITNIANSKQATFSKDGTTLDELSNIVEKLVADGKINSENQTKLQDKIAELKQMSTGRTVAIEAAAEERQKRIKTQEELVSTSKKLTEITAQLVALRGNFEQVQMKSKDTAQARKTEIAEAKQKITELDEELVSIKTENEELRTRLQKNSIDSLEQAEIYRKQEELANLERDSIRQALESKDREIEELLKSSNNAASRSIIGTTTLEEEDINDLEETIHALNTEVCQLKNSVHHYETENADIRKKLDAAERNLAATDEENRVITDMHAQHMVEKDNEIEVLHSRIEAIEREKVVLLSRAAQQAASEVISEKLAVAEQTIETTSTELKQLQARMGQVLQERDKWILTLEKVEQEVLASTSKSEALIHELRDQLADKEVTLQRLTEQLSLVSRQRSASTDKDQTQQHLEQVEEQYAASVAEIKQLKAHIDALVNERNSISAKLNLVQVESKSSEQTSAATIRNLEAAASDRDAKLEILTTKLTILERQAIARRVAVETAAEESQKNLKLQEEYAVARVRITECETEIKTIREKISGMEQENLQLLMRAASAEKSETAVKAELAQLSAKTVEDVGNKDVLIAELKQKAENSNRRSMMNKPSSAALLGNLTTMDLDALRLKERLEESSKQVEKSSARVNELTDSVKRSEELIRNLKAQNQLLMKKNNNNTTDTSSKDLMIEKLKEKLVMTERQSLARKSAIEVAAADHVEKIKLQAALDSINRRYDEALKLSEFLSLELSKIKSKDDMMNIQKVYTLTRSREVLNETSSGSSQKGSPHNSLSRHANTKGPNHLIERTLRSSGSDLALPSSSSTASFSQAGSGAPNAFGSGSSLPHNTGMSPLARMVSVKNPENSSASSSYSSSGAAVAVVASTSATTAMTATTKTFVATVAIAASSNTTTTTTITTKVATATAAATATTNTNSSSPLAASAPAPAASAEQQSHQSSPALAKTKAASPSLMRAFSGKDKKSEEGKKKGFFSKK